MSTINTCTTFSDLPLELKFNVFSYLTPSELSTLVIPTCKEWYEIGKQPILWTDVDINGKTQSSEKITQILRKSVLIRELSLYNVNDNTWITRVPNCNFLRTLNFVSCSFSANDMSRILTLYPRIDTLIMGNLRAKNDSPSNLHINDHDILLDNIANRCKHLKLFVDLGCINVTDNSFMNFLKQRGANLETLALGDAEKITSESLSLIPSACPNLECLILRKISLMTNRDLLKILELRHLSDLIVTGDKLAFSNDFSLQFKYAIFPQVTNLDIHESKSLNDLALGVISKSFPNLKYFTVKTSSTITNFGVDILVTNCKALESLTLEDVRDVTTDLAVEIWYQFPNVVELRLSACPLINFGETISWTRKKKADARILV